MCHRSRMREAMFSNDQNIETIGELVEVVKHYLGLQTEYVKLDITEKVVRLITALSYTVVLLLLLFLSLIYLSFACAHALGTFIGNGWAFCVVSAFYLLLFLLFLINRKRWIERPLVKFLANILLDK